MYKISILLFCLLLTSCTGIRAGDGKESVQVGIEKPFCDVKKVDPNCKVHNGNKNTF